MWKTGDFVVKEI